MPLVIGELTIFMCRFNHPSAQKGVLEHFVSSVPNAGMLPEDMVSACGGTALQVLRPGILMQQWWIAMENGHL